VRKRVKKYKIEIRINSIKKGEPNPIDFEIFEDSDGELHALEKDNETNDNEKYNGGKDDN